MIDLGESEGDETTFLGDETSFGAEKRSCGKRYTAKRSRPNALFLPFAIGV